MPGLGQILNRIFFWSYERGTWQYDVAVALILVFVLLTPTRWFRDQPQVGLPVNSTQVELISKSGELEIYKVDARALAPPERTPRSIERPAQCAAKSEPGPQRRPLLDRQN